MNDVLCGYPVRGAARIGAGQARSVRLFLLAEVWRFLAIERGGD
jgi:hypothetical protein